MQGFLFFLLKILDNMIYYIYFYIGKLYSYRTPYNTYTIEPLKLGVYFDNFK